MSPWICPICCFELPNFSPSQSSNDSIKCSQCGVTSKLNNEKIDQMNQPICSKTSLSLNENASSSLKFGISSIMQKVNLENDASTNELKTAFSDLNSLITKASDMVLLADKIVKHLSQNSLNISNQEASVIQNFFIRLGIASPVTKEAHGSDFHRELAKELSLLLPNLIQDPSHKNVNSKLPFFISLSDLYCVWNRARGISMYEKFI